jgi:hypothetical protein
LVTQLSKYRDLWFNAYTKALMPKKISEIKKETEAKLLELSLKRKRVIAEFKKKVEAAKIEKIRSSIFNK